MNTNNSQWPPILSIGFRPFFLLASLAAIIFPTFWITIFFGYMRFHGSLFNQFSWHSHEMVFAFPWALFGGFVLTASSNWTGQKPCNGIPLAVMVLFWTIGRFALLFDYGDPQHLAPIVLNMLFPVYFLIYMASYLRKFPKQFWVFVPFFSLFLLADTLMLVSPLDNNSYLQIAQNWGLSLVRLMLIIITGRVMPFFTNSRMLSLKIEKSKWVDLMAVLGALGLCIPNLKVISPEFFMLCCAVALIGCLFRFKVWKSHLSFKEPMLAILSVGHFWLIINLGLELYTFVDKSVSFSNAPLHALSAGAIGTLSLGVMSRVSLGHTGRPIVADKVILAAFISIFVGAFFRVFIPIFKPEYFMDSLHHASGWWTFAFCLYLYRMGPYLWKPRPDA